VLLSLVNCHSREEHLNVVRETWLPLVSDEADVKVFRGRGANREPQSDEVFLDCGDGYQDLPDKVRSIVKWAYDHGYDYVLKCDDDVVLKPKELLCSGFEKFDFTGCLEPGCKSGEIKTPWGFCYWLSRRAMELVKDYPLPGQTGSTHSYKHNNDEAWVSTILYKNGIHLNNDQRYYLHRSYVSSAVRPLRAPKRERPKQTQPAPGTFAWCMYIDHGLHNLSAETICDEFKKVFAANL
jgi:hypothetical protein